MRASRTSLDVALLCAVPLFIVRPGSAAAADADAAGVPARRRLVAIAVDGRAPTSALLARWARAHVLRADDDVLLCHVPPHAHPLEAEAATERAAAVAAAAAELGPGVRVAAIASAFDARDALVDLAESGLAQAGSPEPPHLMLLASRGPAALRRAALGSVSAYAVAHAPCALGLVPPTALLAAGEEAP